MSPTSGSASTPQPITIAPIKPPEINYIQNKNHQNYYAETLNVFQQNSSLLLGVAVILMVVGLILIKSGK